MVAVKNFPGLLKVSLQTSSIASTAIDGMLWCYHYTWSITTLTLTVTCCCTATNKPTRHTERDVADMSSLLLFLLPVPPCVPQLCCDRLLSSRRDSCVLTMRLIRKLSIGVSWYQPPANSVFWSILVCLVLLISSGASLRLLSV